MWRESTRLLRGLATAATKVSSTSVSNSLRPLPGKCMGASSGIAAQVRWMAAAPPPFHYQDVMELVKPDIPWRKITSDYVETIKVRLDGLTLLARMVLPGCQDTGTAIIMGKKGQYVWTDGNDEEALSKGIYHAYTETNLRYSQVAPLDMFTEKNTGSNLPAQIETKTLLNPAALTKFIEEKIKGLGTAACPPYHLAIVIGGMSAEYNLKTVKLTSCK
eukprot:gene12971-12792_t